MAGISSRFNEGIPEEKKRHKIIYYEKNKNNTLLYHLLEKCLFADKIILVGGSKYEDVKDYCRELPEGMKNKIILVYNERYDDLASGYSLYVGLKELFSRFGDVKEILFVEGDLDIDKASFEKVITSRRDVLTFSYAPIYAEKAVVLYRDKNERFRYAFNSEHGLLKIDDAFSVILNSGQMWKFIDPQKLEEANEKFYETEKEGTNLRIIQNYIDFCKSKNFELIGLERWTNCNTREDYKQIVSYWEEEIK